MVVIVADTRCSLKDLLWCALVLAPEHQEAGEAEIGAVRVE